MARGRYCWRLLRRGEGVQHGPQVLGLRHVGQQPGLHCEVEQLLGS